MCVCQVSIGEAVQKLQFPYRRADRQIFCIGLLTVYNMKIIRRIDVRLN